MNISEFEANITTKQFGQLLSRNISDVRIVYYFALLSVANAKVFRIKPFRLVTTIHPTTLKILRERRTFLLLTKNETGSPLRAL